MQGQPPAPTGSPASHRVDPLVAAGERSGIRRETPPFSDRIARILDWALERIESERVCWAALGVAMALSVILSLWLTRGVTFHTDDFLYYIANRGFNLKVLLGPHNGHLIFVTRLIVAVVLKVFGARQYVVLRLLEALGVALASGLFFALAKRRTGPQTALAPSVLLLFLGSAWQNSLDPGGITHVYCIAAGLGALLALEKRSPRADLAACGLLVVSVATFSVGLAFVVGTAVSVLLREDRWRRAWIFLLPLALYGAWYLTPRLNTTPFTTNTSVTLSNALLIPNGIADAAAAVAAALTGLSYDFTNPTSYTIDSPWGYVVAAVAIGGLILRFRRGRVPLSLWTSLAVLLTVWASITLATHFTAEPNQNRYIYDGAVLALVVAADALSGIRLSRRALIALYAATALALAANIALLRVGGGFIRGAIPSDRAELAAIEIARDHVSPRFVPQGEPQLTFLEDIIGGAGPYLAAVDHNGSSAFALPELRRQPEPVRELADSTLASALQLGLAPTPAAAAGAKCLPIAGTGPVDFPLRPPGLMLRSAAQQIVTMRRFASVARVKVGDLSGGSFMILRIPTDRAPDAWHVFATRPLTVCELGAR